MSDSRQPQRDSRKMLFVKNDQEKIRYLEILRILENKSLFSIKPEDLWLIPSGFMNALADVLRFGAEKYGENNWILCDQDDAVLRYAEAAARHAYSISKGQFLDQESKLPHAAHLAANAAFLLYFTSANRLKEM